MEEWRLNRSQPAGGFKWRADEYYAREANKPKHMYSPDWVELEISTQRAKARPPSRGSSGINPLRGHPLVPISGHPEVLPKPAFGFVPPSPSSSTSSIKCPWSPTSSPTHAKGLMLDLKPRLSPSSRSASSLSALT
eukprot:CAMPEP_0115078068 /NCGR_PEP_ID=MMETSP0227-20121206/17353_1 /TAXON_ID=89957 /ORGANISM="Polarella glacialis, Strain CCMP 1383" /LENGTH=135 /DNA_ID=CAMNT_0002465431 /DNA_START=62 /DNA_END=469 /DNA_ORIENTATION=+